MSCLPLISSVPSCESPQSLLPAVLWGREPQAAPSAQPLLWWLPPAENTGFGRKARGHPVQKGTSGSLSFPGPHGFEALYFWLCWDLLGAGETAPSSRR